MEATCWFTQQADLQKAPAFPVVAHGEYPLTSITATGSSCAHAALSLDTCLDH